MTIRREWAMPNSDTFSVPIIGMFVKKYLERSSVSVDPFSRNKRWFTHTNDLNPNTDAEYHMEARDFLKMLLSKGITADLFIFDPPYSPRQISECYTSAGLKAVMSDTQNSKLVKECRDLIRQIATTNAVCLSFGWNSAGMGKGWDIEEIMMVAHGGCHNDTICMAERIDSSQGELFKQANKGTTNAV